MELAERVQGTDRHPYALLDGRFDQIPASYLPARRAGSAVPSAPGELARSAEETMATVRGRCLAVPAERRPRVYYARGPAGLETGLAGSINVEIIEFLGLRNVASELTGGLANISLEQVLRGIPR